MLSKYKQKGIEINAQHNSRINNETNRRDRYQKYKKPQSTECFYCGKRGSTNLNVWYGLADPRRNNHLNRNTCGRRHIFVNF